VRAAAEQVNKIRPSRVGIDEMVMTRQGSVSSWWLPISYYSATTTPAQPHS
jgi:hypothetical protein